MSQSPLAKPFLSRGPNMFICFFVLGAASDISFNAIVLCVAYLRRSLGDHVLINLGICQFCGSVIAMVLLLLHAARVPEAVGKPSLHAHAILMFAALGVMFLLNLVILICASMNLLVPGAVLYPLLVFAGLAGGTLQSLGALLAGLMTKFTEHDYAAGAQMNGHGFGIILPSVVQLCLLSMPAISSDRPIEAIVSPVLSMCVLSVAAIMLVWLRSQESYRICAEGGLDALIMKPGVTEVIKAKFSWWMLTRFKQVSMIAFGLMCTFAATVYCGQMTPFMPVGHSTFWATKLPTLLLSITNLCDFVGRTGAARLPSNWFRCSSLVSILLARAALVVVILLHLHGVLLPVSGMSGASLVAPIAALYAVSSWLSGMASVALTQHAQSKCMRTSGPNMDSDTNIPCPMAGQIMWLATMTGAILGTLLAAALPH